MKGLIYCSEVATLSCATKHMFLKALQNSQYISSYQRFSVGKQMCWYLFLIKLQAFRPATLSKKAPTQMFFQEICEIFKNIYFEEHLRTITSEMENTCASETFLDKVARVRTDMQKYIYFFIACC